MWEIYIQFCYDKRLVAQFSVLEAPSGKINFSVSSNTRAMEYKNFSEINPENFDKIILLTTKTVNVEDKVITLQTLMKDFIRKTYAEVPLLNFLQRHPQVKLFLTKFPSMNRYNDSLKFQKQLRSLEATKNILRKDKSGNVKTPLDKFGYTNEEILELIEAPAVISNLDGSTTMGDNDHPLMRIQQGKRITAYQPEHFLNKIYFIGTCHDFGINAPYDKTVASYLQKMLNEHGLLYRVENEAQRYFGRYQDIFYNLNNIKPQPGDIVFIYVNGVHAKDLPFLDLSDAFDPPHDYKKIFCVTKHINELGYKILAERYFKFLTENNFFRDVEFNYHTPPRYITDMVYLRSSSKAA